jgi:hypothetical protein
MPPANATGLLSDVTGRITHALLALPASDAEAVPPIMECHAAVCEALGKGTRYTVIVHAEHEEAVRAAGRGFRIETLVWHPSRVLKVKVTEPRMEGRTLRLGTIPGWADFTPWVQDTFLVRYDRDGRTLLASPEIRRPEGSHDDDVAPFVARALGWRLEMLPLGLEASNVLTDGRYVIVGADVVRDKPRASRRDLFGALRGDERVVTMPRGVAQPLPHEDLYITLAGNGPEGPLALVGSQRVAAAVRGRRFERDGIEIALDAVAADLERLRYAVRRLPLEAHTADRVPVRGWTSYNNALVERAEAAGGKAGNRVILPAFGTDGGPPLRDLDAAAAAVWSGAGFEVRFAEGPFTWLAERQGSLRCLTKVLDRGE